MKFSMEDGEIPILPVFNFEEAKLDLEYPLHDDDKCNLHMLNKLSLEKKENKKK